VLAQGGFGDLSSVCKAGDAKGATDTGVTDTEIHVGSVTDKGSEVRPELNREMYDAAVAFAKWCNEKGGILGRKLVIDDRDAKLFEYPQRIADSCGTDLALVGGGAVLDDDNEGARVACGLPNIAGYVVSPKARAATLQVQPIPNPVYKGFVGAYKSLDTLTNGGMKAYGVMTAPLPSTIVVRDALVEGVGLSGGNVVYNAQYNVLCETNWDPFVQDMKSKGVKVLEFVGEPDCFTSLQKQMDVTGYYPDVSIQSTNFYERKFAAEGGKTAKNTYVRMGFTPFEMASNNKATQDYLDLMKQYNPSGKVAVLGAQATSAYLLFAKAATECGSSLTRTCLIEKAKTVTKWSGGGLHAPTDPSTNTPSPCFALIKVGDGTFAYDKAATNPNEGIFNCSATNIVDLKNDYGVPR
jgi:ABC-type branched-subunit amino acid transport system substrate-binding protein